MPMMQLAIEHRAIRAGNHVATVARFHLRRGLSLPDGDRLNVNRAGRDYQMNRVIRLFQALKLLERGQV
jgi:hypothetical protein